MFGGGFGGFPGMAGGHPFAGMGGGSSEPVNNNRYYEILGVSKNADAAEIKKAHRKLALRMHPDKGGDPEQFKTLNEAYEVLKDPKKKEIYDQYGEEAVKEGGAGGGGMPGGMDVFSELFGGGRSARSRGPPKSEDVSHRMRVSLKDFYLGCTKKLALKRPTACAKCSGTGTKSGTPATCQQCKGQGIEMVMRQIGPGMITQMQRKCSACGGKGKNVRPGDECGRCAGEAIIEEKKTFDVTLDQGAPDEHKVVLRGEAGVTEPGMEPGDVVFHFVQEKSEDDIFKRQGNDILIMKYQISLKQALCKTDVNIRHLDGRVITIQRPAGTSIQPGQWIRVPDEGMPVHHRTFMKGNLYVRFEVMMPETLPAQLVLQLENTLPDDGESAAMDVDEADEVELQRVGDNEALQEELMPRMRSYREHARVQDDDDEHTGGQRMQCASQ